MYQCRSAWGWCTLCHQRSLAISKVVTAMAPMSRYLGVCPRVGRSVSAGVVTSLFAGGCSTPLVRHQGSLSARFAFVIVGSCHLGYNACSPSVVLSSSGWVQQGFCPARSLPLSCSCGIRQFELQGKWNIVQDTHVLLAMELVRFFCTSRLGSEGCSLARGCISWFLTWLTRL